MSKVQYRHDLDCLRCQHGCDDHPIAFHSNCHPDTPTWTFYDRETGTLTIECARCQRAIVTVAVETRLH